MTNPVRPDVESSDLGTLERFQAHLEAGDTRSLEEAWMEEVGRSAGPGPRDPSPFLAAADSLLARGDRERAQVLLELLLPTYEEHPAQRLEVLRRLIVAAPRRLDLRTGFTETFKQAHPGSLAELCLSLSGAEKAAEPAKALSMLDRLFMFQPGTTVVHASGWGVGVVESVDPILRQVVVDLEKKRHHRIDMKVVAEILEPLPPRHFFTLSRQGPDTLRAMAESEPVELVEVVVMSFGNPQGLKALKARLVPEVIPAEGWTRWWNRTKNLLRESGYWRVADRSPFTVERLKKSVSYEDELLRQFEAGDFEDRMAITRRHARDRSTYPRLRERALRELKSLAALTADVRIVEVAAALERLASDEPGTEGLLLQALRTVSDPVEAIRTAGPEERRRAVEVLQEACPDTWPDVALGLLSRGDDALRDEVSKLLVGSPIEAKAVGVISEAARVPRVAPDLFAWACLAYLEGRASPLLTPFKVYSSVEILGRVLDALDSLGLKAERDGRALVRDSLTRVRALLSIDNGKFFRDVVRELPRAEARSVYHRVLASGGLSEPLRVKLLEILAGVIPDITRTEARPIWEEDWIYTMEGGLAKKQAEFRDLTEEKLPKNFQDIGRAAAFGDLSENAEYTAALEERDRLTKRATEIKAQLDKVRMITPELLKQGEVTLGAKVRLANPKTNHEVTYRVLGPWDGAPEDGVLSYKSPLAMALFGKHVGEEVEAQLPGGTERFRVVDVGSAFEDRRGTGAAAGGGTGQGGAGQGGGSGGGAGSSRPSE